MALLGYFAIEKLTFQMEQQAIRMTNIETELADHEDRLNDQQSQIDHIEGQILETKKLINKLSFL